MKRLLIRICPILCILLILLAGYKKNEVEIQTILETTTITKNAMVPDPIPTLPETSTTIEEIVETETTTEQYFEEYYEEEIVEQYYQEEYYEEEQYYETEPVYVDQGITRERIIDYAAVVYGVSYDWTVWLIGTTWNEGYQGDRYLEYAWACQIINVYSGWSAWDLDCIWGGYYSLDHAYSGYYAADDITLQMVWEALTDTDTRICQVDGMINYYVPGYYLIYDSPVYNCQVWGN